jgi:opacity protein-like surface antigen
MRATKLSALLLVLACAVPGYAMGQDMGETEQAEQMEEDAASQSAMSPYIAPESGWANQRFSAGIFWGNMAGGTSLGLVENVFFRTTLNLGTDDMLGARFAYVFAPRFDVELEWATSSPGLVATLTDLGGQGKTEVPFADLKMNRVTASVNYSMIERTRRIVPYLTLGIGLVTVSSEDEGIIKSRKPGLIYGGGIRVRVIDPVALRLDARGLRSGFGTKQEEDDLPGVFVGDFNASNFLWSVGVDIRF